MTRQNIREFLARIAPFTFLDEGEIDLLIEKGKQEVFNKATPLYHQNYSKLKHIDIILEGGYDTYFIGQDLQKHLDEPMAPGEIYGPVSLLFNNKLSIRTVESQPGTRILKVPKQVFLDLVKGHTELSTFFNQQFAQKMLNRDFSRQMRLEKEPGTNYMGTDYFFTKSVSSVQPKPLLTCSPDSSVIEAAQIMTKGRQSCIFIRDKDGNYLGYLTDITLREKVLAMGGDSHLPVKEFMQQPIFTIHKDALIYEAILMMFKHKIRYVVVENDGKYIGLLSRSKLLSDQAYSPFVFIQSLKLANNADELKEKWQRVPDIVYQLLSRGAKSENVNQVISTISDSITLKIIENAIDEMGPPPCRFVFMTLGSEGRMEQTLKTDQDNAIIYEDRPAEEREYIRSYFLKLADRVSEELNTVGFVFCEGDFMAKNPKWNHSLSHWKQNYSNWIVEIMPKTAANFATFFDTRRVYGDRRLIEELREHIKVQLEKSPARLFYHLAVEALKYEPPLTFFKNIKTISKDNQEVFNIKHAMTPIVDLVRVYALKHRIMVTNTGERLKQLYENDLISKEQYYELLQSYYYLMGLRLKRQAKTILRGQGKPTNYVVPKSLTNIERVTLREIFKVIERFQLRMRLEFTGISKF